MTITYRDGRVEDGAALDRLFDTVFCDTFAHLYLAEDLDAFLTSYGIEDWLADLADPDHAYRVAESGGELVGYVKLGPNKLPIEASGSTILLDQFYVATEHHGAGIARELMDWAIGEARRRGAKELYLTVFIENHRARRFYERYGFEPVGRYEFMVGNQADEDIIMRKSL
jgi:ribosomal protein S18 acetylase RimI-like enzyme